MFFSPIVVLSLLMCFAEARTFGHVKFHKAAARRADKDLGKYPNNHLPRQFPAVSGLYASGGAVATSSGKNYTFSGNLKAASTAAGTAVPTASPIAIPAITNTYSSTVFVTTRSAYQVCDPASSSCSTVLATRTTTACDATLTGFFTRVTVTDCQQSVTFSTKSSFRLLSTTPSASLQARQAVITANPRIQSIVSYYVAPWQSIAANTPNNITIVVCIVNDDGSENCSNVQEVWAVVTTYVPVTSTSTLFISSYFKNNALIVAGNNTITASAGALQLSTVLVYTTVTASMTTLASQIAASAQGIPTRTTTIRSTVSVAAHTVYANAGSAAESSPGQEPTTTLTSTTQATETITLAKSSSTMSTVIYRTPSSTYTSAYYSNTTTTG